MKFSLVVFQFVAFPGFQQFSVIASKRVVIEVSSLKEASSARAEVSH